MMYQCETAVDNSAAVYLQSVFVTFTLSELRKGFGPWKKCFVDFPKSLPIMENCKGADMFPYKYKQKN